MSNLSRLSWRGTCILGLTFVLAGSSCPNTGGPPGSTTTNKLFVINNDSSNMTDYFAGLSGNIAPSNELVGGGATQLFQPRGIVVTGSGVLLISRGNGGIAGWNNANTVDGSQVADRVIDGSSTKLDSPIALAYDKTNDRLFVGNASAANGVLVFDHVSNAAFDGNVAPSRMFSPPDRSPTTNQDMTVDALALDSSGNLWVADSSGVNSSRVLVFGSAGTATGQVSPARTITSSSWGIIQTMVVTSDNHFLVVDGGNYVRIFDNASSLTSAVSPSRTLTSISSSSELDGLFVTTNGTGIVSDRNQDSIYSYSGIVSLTGSAAPTATLSGTNTDLVGPRQIFVTE